MSDWMLYNIIMLPCVLIFVAIGIWGMKRDTPMHFWSGTLVDPESITDAKAYNVENAIMWFKYCIPFVLSMAIAPFNLGTAATVMSIGCVGGIPWMIITYKKIYKKYKKED